MQKMADCAFSRCVMLACEVVHRFQQGGAVPNGRLKGLHLNDGLEIMIEKFDRDCCIIVPKKSKQINNWPLFGTLLKPNTFITSLMWKSM